MQNILLILILIVLIFQSIILLIMIKKNGTVIKETVKETYNEIKNFITPQVKVLGKDRIIRDEMKHSYEKIKKFNKKLKD